MKFNSKIHGELEYSEENKIQLIKALPGFDGLKEFILVDLKDYPPFKLLQSLENDTIAFILISPFDFFNKYEFKLSNEVINNLTIEDSKNVIVLNIINLNSDSKKVTTNLKAPIIINKQNNMGQQIILDIKRYKIKQPLLEE